MQRKASAVWKGGLKDGKGAVSSSSGVLTRHSSVQAWLATISQMPRAAASQASNAKISATNAVRLRGFTVPAGVGGTGGYGGIGCPCPG